MSVDHTDHLHEHNHARSTLSQMEPRWRALESILRRKGYVDPAALDLLIETYEKKVGPHNGARVIVKAWIDPDFKTRLLPTERRRSHRSGMPACRASTW